MDTRGHLPVTLPHPNPTESYWHDPLSRLANYRSSEVLPQYVDTVIVGSGISGAMIAWNLLGHGQDGKDILMLEARTAVGGATGRNGTSYLSSYHPLNFCITDKPILSPTYSFWVCIGFSMFYICHKYSFYLSQYSFACTEVVCASFY
jgi:hypothetical protein